MMHADLIPSDEMLAARLLRNQAPDWSGLDIRRVPSSGTDNALYRIGDGLVLRLPMRSSAADLLAKEIRWLPHFSKLPLTVPRLHLGGRATAEFAHDFAVLDWLDGTNAVPDQIADKRLAALDMARFLNALQDLDATGAPPAGACNHDRGVALDRLSEKTRAAIDTLADEIDAGAAHALWREALRNPYEGPAVWLHGDLKADNLLARDGKLFAVLDWGLCAVGDPAADHAVAWTWIEPDARSDFRVAAGIDGGGWLRAKGWALYGAVIALSYYRGGRNEALCRQSRQTLGRLGLI